MGRENHLLALIEDMLNCMPQLLWIMAVATNDSAIVFSLISIYDCIAPCNLSELSTSAQLRLIFVPYALKLIPNKFGPTI